MPFGRGCRRGRYKLPSIENIIAIWSKKKFFFYLFRTADSAVVVPRRNRWPTAFLICVIPDWYSVCKTLLKWPPNIVANAYLNVFTLKWFRATRTKFSTKRWGERRGEKYFRKFSETKWFLSVNVRRKTKKKKKNITNRSWVSNNDADGWHHPFGGGSYVRSFRLTSKPSYCLALMRERHQKLRLKTNNSSNGSIPRPSAEGAELTATIRMKRKVLFIPMTKLIRKTQIRISKSRTALVSDVEDGKMSAGSQPEGQSLIKNDFCRRKFGKCRKSRVVRGGRRSSPDYKRIRSKRFNLDDFGLNPKKNIFRS